MFGKGRGIENDEIVALDFIQILESVFTESLVTRIAWEIQFYVATGQFDGLGRTVDRVNRLCTATHGIE